MPAVWSSIIRLSARPLLRQVCVLASIHSAVCGAYASMHWSPMMQGSIMHMAATLHAVCIFQF